MGREVLFEFLYVLAVMFVRVKEQRYKSVEGQTQSWKKRNQATNVVSVVFWIGVFEVQSDTETNVETVKQQNSHKYLFQKYFSNLFQTRQKNT